MSIINTKIEQKINKIYLEILRGIESLSSIKMEINKENSIEVNSDKINLKGFEEIFLGVESGLKKSSLTLNNQGSMNMESENILLNAKDSIYIKIDENNYINFYKGFLSIKVGGQGIKIENNDIFITSNSDIEIKTNDQKRGKITLSAAKIENL